MGAAKFLKTFGPPPRSLISQHIVSLHVLIKSPCSKTAKIWCTLQKQEGSTFRLSSKSLVYYECLCSLAPSATYVSQGSFYLKHIYFQTPLWKCGNRNLHLSDSPKLMEKRPGECRQRKSRWNLSTNPTRCCILEGFTLEDGLDLELKVRAKCLDSR